MRIVQVHALPEGMEKLAACARAEGYRFLERLINDFATGTLRFEAEGEALFAAYLRDDVEADILQAVGGLTHCPYSPKTEDETEKRVGRVRRLYVHPAARSKGLGRQMVRRIEQAARGHFTLLTLCTPNEAASRFYEACGYCTSTVHKISHYKLLDNAEALR